MKQSDFQNLHNIIEQIAENSNRLSEEFVDDNKDLPNLKDIIEKIILKF
jgi:hypothetical protein